MAGDVVIGSFEDAVNLTDATDVNGVVVLNLLLAAAKGSDAAKSKFIVLAEAVLNNRVLPSSVASHKGFESFFDLHGELTETVRALVRANYPTTEKLHRDAGGFQLSANGYTEVAVHSQYTIQFDLAAKDFHAIPPQAQVKAFIENVKALLEPTVDASADVTDPDVQEVRYG